MKAVVLLALIGAACARDLILGSKGTKIFEEHATASPALWKQTRKIDVHNNGTDVISRIVAIDLREDKDGEVNIVDGGLGQRNLSLELKSPTILRGYDFQIAVYAVPEDEYVPEVTQTTVTHPSHLVPASNDDNQRQVPSLPNEDNTQKPSEGQEPVSLGPNAPAAGQDQSRLNPHAMTNQSGAVSDIVNAQETQNLEPAVQQQQETNVKELEGTLTSENRDFTTVKTLPQATTKTNQA